MRRAVAHALLALGLAPAACTSRPREPVGTPREPLATSGATAPASAPALPAALAPASPPATAARPTATGDGGAPAEDLPRAWRLPLGWRWLTNLHVGFTVAYPGLPTLDALAAGGQRLVVHTDRAEYAVGVAPEQDEAPRYRREITAQGWTIANERALAGGARDFEVTNGALVTHTRLVPAAARTFVLTVTTQRGDDGDAPTFLDSFAPAAQLESRTLRFAPGGFAVVAPARMSEWEERSADPPLRGYAGLVDGAQLGAAFADVSAAALAQGPLAFLRRGTASSLQQLGGATLSRSEEPYHGFPSIWLEHRGDSGVYVTRRVVLAHGRYYDIAVYAPSGTEPAWADAFVDALALEP
jgi:hypothetical protein